MKNQPMSSGEKGNLLIFSLLMAPSLIFIVGIIPAIFLVFGIYMMKKNRDFSNIDTAVKNFKKYVLLVLIGCALISIYCGYRSFIDDYSGLYLGCCLVYLVLTGIAFFYLIVVQVLFYSPMNKHREWVEVNGIFSTKQ